MKKILILAIVLMGTLVLSSCGGSKGIRPSESFITDEPMPAGAESARKIELTFSAEDIKPDKVTMKAGEKVVFIIKNTDDDKKEDHNFVDSAAGLTEILVHPGQTVRRLWSAPAKAGTYVPTCAIHPWIRMTVVVE